MPGGRFALLIATGRYDQPGLQQLRSPARDAEGLAEVLSDQDIGAFQVRTVVDGRHHEVNRAVEEFFLDRSRDDLLLLHLSCHGVKNDSGELFFAARDTYRGLLGSTAVSAAFLQTQMRRCRARSIVLLLDCCYSGAFLAGTKGDTTVHVKDELAGHGRAVLTATNRTEYAWEGGHLSELEPEPSRFTGAVIEGLRTGKADIDGDGQVGVHELYEYVYERLHTERVKQRPQIWAELEYRVVVAYAGRRAVPVLAPPPPKSPPLPSPPPPLVAPRPQAAVVHRLPVIAPVLVAYGVPDVHGTVGSHPGVDFEVPTDTRVRAVAAGRVARAGWGREYGYRVVVRHTDGHHSTYGCLASIDVATGDEVPAGATLGRSGSLVHFGISDELRPGTDLDPLAYLAERGVDVSHLTQPRGEVDGPGTHPRPGSKDRRDEMVAVLSHFVRTRPDMAGDAVETLCSYLRGASPTGGSTPRESGVREAIEAILDRPLGVDAPLDLSGTDLSMLSLESADLAGAKLKGSQLALASLRNADLRDTDLREADLTAVDLTHADLGGADLTAATGLTAAALRKARITAATVCPEHLGYRMQGTDWTVVDLRAAAPSTLALPLAVARERARKSVAELSVATGLTASEIEAVEAASAPDSTVIKTYLRGLGVHEDALASCADLRLATTGGATAVARGPVRGATRKPRAQGPWDRSEVTAPADGRVDLGGLLVPAVADMELRVEVADDTIVAATVVLTDSAIQLQAFATIWREGIWDPVRREIADGIERQGGVTEESDGPLGRELCAQVPVALPDGGSGYQVVRFVGVDGPRWFLRGVISGRAAVEPQTEIAGVLERLFRDTVVVRGTRVSASRDPIVLELPEGASLSQGPETG